jgi:uncharacterized protein
LLLVGLIAGIMGGGLGVGGGIVLVPLLIYVGMERHNAHATSLAAIVLISIVGAASFASSGEVNVVLGLTIGIGGIFGSVIGANTMNKMSPRALTIVFAIILLIAGIRLLSGADPLPGSADLAFAGRTLIALGIGLVAGFFAGLAGIGGGVVNVPAGVFFLGMSQHEAQGTSLIAIVLTAIAGTAANYRNERLVLREGLLAGLGGAVGSLLGSQLALGASEDTLALILGALVVLVAIRTLVRVARGGQSTEGTSTA